MASYDYGKCDVANWIRYNFSENSSILDVGACDGKWRDLLNEYPNMDAVEIYKPNITNYKLEDKYRKVFNANIIELEYGHYDLIIFGDVIEHMTVADAKKVLKYAERHCEDYVIGVPFQYKQDAIYGNAFERHIQDDLTKEIFFERYPNTEMILDLEEYGYAYYHRGM